jgi:hypothetical protein
MKEDKFFINSQCHGGNNREGNQVPYAFYQLYALFLFDGNGKFSSIT